MKKENKHRITYILIGREKKKINRKDWRQFFYLMMSPLDTSLGTKPRIRNPTCQNCPSGNPKRIEARISGSGSTNLERENREIENVLELPCPAFLKSAKCQGQK